MAQNENGGFSAGCVLFSFFVGGLLGAGVALLVAPKSGKETRQQLKEMAEDVKGKAETYIEQMKDDVASVVEKGKEMVEKGKGLLEEQKNVLASAVEAGKEAYGKEKEKLAKE
jgi:gas vesicle protein